MITPHTPKLVKHYAHASKATHYTLLTFIFILEMVVTLLFHSVILHIAIASSVTFWEVLVTAVEEI